MGRYTVDHNEQVYPEYSKALADSVICILELSLHDGGVDLDKDDSSQTGEDHSASVNALISNIGT